jgi:DNA-binding response OmpR family regulator
MVKLILVPCAPAMANLLVIDDNESVRKTLEYCLSAAGHQVHLTPDGFSGLWYAAELPVDLALIEANLPRMDGLAICRAMRADPRTARIPLLLMTACATKKMAALGRIAGANEVLEKPAFIQNLTATIYRNLPAPLNGGASSPDGFGAPGSSAPPIGPVNAASPSVRG